MSLVLKTFAQINGLESAPELFAGSCKVGVCTTENALGALRGRMQHLRQEYPAETFIVQSVEPAALAADGQGTHALLTVLDDRNARTLILDGRMQFRR